MGPITEVFPAPCVVPCGDSQIKIAELRLRDLVLLQAVLDSLAADPLAAIQGTLPESGPARREALSAAYDLAEVGPPVYGEAGGRAYFGTPEGGGVFLWVVGRRWKSNQMTPEKAGELFARCTAAEFGHIWRICHGVSALRAITRMLTPFAADIYQASVAADWGEMVDKVMTDFHWTYDQILDLTLTQWIRARNGGVLPTGEIMVPRSAAGKAFLDKQEAYEKGEIDELGNPVVAPPDGPSEAASGPPGG
jgi:hypothetical protein